MSGSIFREGGPHNIKHKGNNQFEMSVSIPTDSKGFIARECPNYDCSPGYFKIKNGTGITEEYSKAYCPYCRHESDPNDFTTKAQAKYAKDILLSEAQKGIGRELQKAFGIGSSGRKKLNEGMISMELRYKPSRPKPVSRPIEEELRRDLICPKCTLEHSVFGLASWCPDCGSDILLTHIDVEFSIINKMLDAVENRKNELGARVAARDIENALEDTVSIFEASLKIIVRKLLSSKNLTKIQIDDLISNRIRNSFQNVDNASKSFLAHCDINIYEGIDEGAINDARDIFQKRHPITHNLGVVDRKYIERVQTGELEGREIYVTVEEIHRIIDFSSQVFRNIYIKIQG
ncbi:hypothetical protein KAR91_14065 [Candidatus Pacearchaeota archaeon]|nr:hypothetical protein [Candidatus Pacearchaeota archaeon]